MSLCVPRVAGAKHSDDTVNTAEPVRETSTRGQAAASSTASTSAKQDAAPSGAGISGVDVHRTSRGKRIDVVDPESAWDLSTSVRDPSLEQAELASGDGPFSAYGIHAVDEMRDEQPGIIGLSASGVVGRGAGASGPGVHHERLHEGLSDAVMSGLPAMDSPTPGLWSVQPSGPSTQILVGLLDGTVMALDAESGRSPPLPPLSLSSFISLSLPSLPVFLSLSPYPVFLSLSLLPSLPVLLSLSLPVSPVAFCPLPHSSLCAPCP